MQERGNVTFDNSRRFDRKQIYLSVGLDVTQKVKEDAGGLLGEGALVTGSLVLLAHGVSANAAGVFREGDGGLVSKDVAKVDLRLVQVHALNGVGDLAAVLVVHTEVGTTSLNGLGGVVDVTAEVIGKEETS